jgi:hypothetical protein
MRNIGQDYQIPDELWKKIGTSFYSGTMTISFKNSG